MYQFFAAKVARNEKYYKQLRPRHPPIKEFKWINLNSILQLNEASLPHV